jgi:hypothetical protein
MDRDSDIKTFSGLIYILKKFPYTKIIKIIINEAEATKMDL